MRRRTFFASILALPVAIAGLIAPRALFARDIRHSTRKWNRNGGAHTERRAEAMMDWRTLEDPQRFHEQAESVRLAMIDALRAEGAPINVWRVGHMHGVAGRSVDVITGEPMPWKDEHYFYVRTRVSVERPPFTHPA